MRTKCRAAVPMARWVQILLGLSVWVGGQTLIHAESPKVPAPGPQKVVEPQAKAMLMGMGKFLSQTPRFSVTIRAGYDVVQESGQKVEFGEVRKVTVSRPNRMRVEVEQSDGVKNLVLFDGKEITVSSTPQDVYAKVSIAGDLDKAMAYFINELHMRLPLAMLIVNRLPAEIERRVESIGYVEKTTLFDVPCHHLAARTQTVDFQIWVAEGEQPLPHRVVITYKDGDGQPQFWAQFSDWDLSPDVTDSMFAFTPAKGAEKVAFLSQPREAAVQTKEATKQTGAHK